MAFFQSIITIVIFLAMLGILVVIHELGHFVTARLANIRVHEFGIGFPPRAKVLSSHGETLYTLNWLPIGGFVRLEGEDGDSDDPRSFTRAKLPVKLLVLLAGVGMNLVLALVIFTATAWFPGQAVELQFQSVQADSPAAAAGLRPNEAIVSIDGRYFDQFRVDGPEAMVQQLRSKAGQTVHLGVISTDGTVRDVTVTLRPPSQIDDQHGALGIVNLVPRLSKVGFTRAPGDAVALGVARTADAFQLIIGGLRDIANSIATKPTEAPPASGPVGIAVQVGDVFWQAGPLATLYLAGILSANLALVNILPFPPLDGGRMLMIVLKSVVGNRISLQAERLTYLVGFGFLFAFLIWITYFDIARIGSGTTQ
jgi:regulator of sigma E protease